MSSRSAASCMSTVLGGSKRVASRKKGSAMAEGSEYVYVDGTHGIILLQM